MGRTSLQTALAISASVFTLACSGVTPPRHTTFTFGRVGGNIRPYTVTITRTGIVKAEGPVTVAHLGRKIAPARLARLDRLVRTAHFFALRTLIICPGALPDLAAATITVSTPARDRRVVVRGTCNHRFRTLYKALTAAAGARG